MSNYSPGHVRSRSMSHRFDPRACRRSVRCTTRSLTVSAPLHARGRTERVVVRTGVILAFVRSPMLTAYTAWDLAAMSNGRFELGLGTQIKQNIEGRYSVQWSEPVARMRDYVDSLRAIFATF